MPSENWNYKTTLRCNNFQKSNEHKKQQLCSENRPISQNKWFNKLLARLKHIVVFLFECFLNLIIFVKSSKSFSIIWKCTLHPATDTLVRETIRLARIVEVNNVDQVVIWNLNSNLIEYFLYENISLNFCQGIFSWFRDLKMIITLCLYFKTVFKYFIYLDKTYFFVKYYVQWFTFF